MVESGAFTADKSSGMETPNFRLRISLSREFFGIEESPHFVVDGLRGDDIGEKAFATVDARFGKHSRKLGAARPYEGSLSFGLLESPSFAYNHDLGVAGARGAEPEVTLGHF